MLLFSKVGVFEEIYTVSITGMYFIISKSYIKRNEKRN